MGDKVSSEDKKSVDDKLAELKEALKGTDLEQIKAKQEELQKAFFAVSEKLYKDAQAQAGAEGAGAETAPNDDVVDADYKEVDDNDQK